jgi:PAS domain S-box-containing protein
MAQSEPEGPGQTAYDELRDRLEAAEETLRAIRSGEVDALVVDVEGEGRLFTLQGADHFYRVLVEGMPEGAAVLDASGLVVYANARLGEIFGRPSDELVGRPFRELLEPELGPILDVALAQGDDTAIAGVPLIVRSGGERVPIALSLRTLGEESASVALIVTDLSAIERAEQGRRRAEQQYEREHTIALELQRALGPAELPELDWVALSGLYLPGVIDPEVGGDWYDAVAVSEGRLALVIGDVAGRGLPAAVNMAELRIAVRAFLQEGRSPAEALGAVNHLARVGGMATLFCAVLDADRRSLRYVNAGHPPPLILDAATGSVTKCEQALGPPVGVGWHARYHEVEVVLPDEPTIVLYTDGVIELRGESLDAGLARLTDAAAIGVAEPLEDLAARLVSTAASDEDDRAVLTARLLTPPLRRLMLTIPAIPEALSRLRGQLRRFLLANGVDADTAYDLVLAASEIAANATEHAYELRDAQFVCRATVADGNVTISVRDQGRWRAPRQVDGRGRGLRLVESLVDQLDLRPSTTGTEAVIRRKVEQTVR